MFRTARLALDLSPAEAPLLGCMPALRASGPAVEVQVRATGVPADEILAAAEAGADPVVSGSRSHDAVHRLFLGRVAREVIGKARQPVPLEWVEPTAAATAARCEAVCTNPLRRVGLVTDHSRHAQAAERAAVALSLPEMIILRKVLTLWLIATFVGVAATGVLLVGFVFNAPLAG